MAQRSAQVKIRGPACPSLGLARRRRAPRSRSLGLTRRRRAPRSRGTPRSRRDQPGGGVGLQRQPSVRPLSRALPQGAPIRPVRQPERGQADLARLAGEVEGGRERVDAGAGEGQHRAVVGREHPRRHGARKLGRRRPPREDPAHALADAQRRPGGLLPAHRGALHPAPVGRPLGVGEERQVVHEPDLVAHVDQRDAPEGGDERVAHEDAADRQVHVAREARLPRDLQPREAREAREGAVGAPVARGLMSYGRTWVMGPDQAAR